MQPLRSDRSPTFSRYGTTGAAYLPTEISDAGGQNDWLDETRLPAPLHDLRVMAKKKIEVRSGDWFLVGSISVQGLVIKDEEPEEALPTNPFLLFREKIIDSPLYTSERHVLQERTVAFAFIYSTFARRRQE